MAYYISSGRVLNGVTLNDDYMYIYSGGVANNTTVNSYGYMDISSGGVANSTTVNLYGQMCISSGGTATDINWTPCVGHVIAEDGAYVTYASTYSGVYFGSYNQLLSSAPTMDNKIVSGFGLMYVMSGGVANSTTVNSWGSMYISSGGVANSTTMSGGSMRISSGGVANSTTMSGGSMRISNGGVANSISVSGGSLNIYSGGTATNIIALSRVNFGITVASNTHIQGTYAGSAFEMKDASISNYTVNPGGRMCIESGGTANSTTISSSGWMYISSGGVANSTTVNPYGRMCISSGGVANSTRLTYDRWGGGDVIIFSGGVANDTTVNSLCDISISSGGIANRTILGQFGRMWIYSGGVANSTTVTSNGIMYISGGVANSTTVNSRGSMYISSGGIANGITISACGAIFIDSSRVDNLTLNAGGRINGFSFTEDKYIEQISGQLEISPNVRWDSYGMIVSSAGAVGGVVVNAQKTMTVSAGGVANEIVANGGDIYIQSGGTASIAYNPWESGTVYSSTGAMVTYLDRDANVYYGGKSDGFIKKCNSISDIDLIGQQSAIIYSGGEMNRAVLNGASYSSAVVYVSGGMANSTTVNFNGFIYISSGGTANSTTVNLSGYMYISSGGVANSTTINAWGGMYIYAGGSANRTTISSGGWMYISSGGIANDTIVNNTGRMYISSGGVANTTVNSNGSMYISSGGVANSTTVNSYGSVYISSGGVANSTTVNSYGRMGVYGGGTANSTTVNSGSMHISRGGVANSTTIAGGSMHISSGGVANRTTVNSGGDMRISSGGVANSTSVNNGYMYILRGGVANSTTINSGGMNIYGGGVANSTTINSGGMNIYGGGVANSTTIAGGVMHISSGGVANRTTVNSGGDMRISSGGVHRGSLQIESGAVVSAYSGSVIDFTVADRTAADGYLINDLALVKGAPTCTITVSETQKSGIYKLAQGAANFTGSITIGDGTVDYGTITVNGDDFVRNGVIYSLDKVYGDLTLTVTKPVASNLQGNVNGVSWNGSCDAYTVIYSNDNFATGLQVNTTTNAVDTYGMPGGTYQWKVAAEGEEYKGNNIVSDNTTAAQKLISDADGNMDLFFARSSGTWNSEYFAQRSGTQKLVALNGKNRIQDVFIGSSDANILVLTDDANGDALFIDDMYSAFGTQARLSQIDEIRAGAGNDIVDLTSDKYAFAGDKLTIFGGAGDDTIWANSGNDVLIGGAGNDSLFGGGGNDTFIFGDNWGNDTVEQLSGGSVTLHFENGSLANWNAETLTYSDGVNSVTVTGTSDITLKFGADASLPAGVFTDAANEKIFEDKNKGMIA